MADQDLRQLFQAAKVDPELRPTYLQHCQRQGHPPRETESLTWEWEAIQKAEQTLLLQQRNFCLRYIEDFLRTSSEPCLVIETHNEGAESFDNCFVLTEDEDIKLLWQPYPLVDAIISECLESLHQVFGPELSLKFEIIGGKLALFIRTYNRETKLWDWTRDLEAQRKLSND